MNERKENQQIKTMTSLMFVNVYKKKIRNTG